jgi:hypothetical protein
MVSAFRRLEYSPGRGFRFPLAAPVSRSRLFNQMNAKAAIGWCFGFAGAGCFTLSSVQNRKEPE